MKLSTAFERVAIVVASFALSIGLIALLSGYFAGHDPAGVSGHTVVIGEQFRDLGDAHMRPGDPRPGYDSNPPTSGAHIPQAVRRDGTRLNNDQLLSALEVGDIVIFYGPSAPPPGLSALANRTAGPFTPALAAAGQAVILARRPGTLGLTALAWDHLLSVGSPKDPRLREFIDYLLGRGATRH